MEVVFGQTPVPLEPVVGSPRDWPAPWGPCWLVPLYHPSSANGTRWRRYKVSLRRFLKDRSDPALGLMDA
jgi:hypothetical protein